MRRIILPKIQGFYLTIILKDDLLILKMEEESSEMTFSITLDNNSISQMTYGLFQDKEQLAKGLEDAASQPDSGLMLSLSPGQMTYTVHFPEGIPEESFTIYLLQQVSESEEVRKSKERLEKLENMMGQMEQKMMKMAETFESSCAGLKRKEAPDFYFSKKSINDPNYYFFIDDYQTAKLRAQFNFWMDPLEILPEIPLSGQHSYSMVINERKGGIYFGIIATEKRTNRLNHNYAEYKYCTRTGEICGKVHKKAEGKSPYGDAGSVIKMCVDTDKGILTFFVNNRAVNSCEILKGYQYFAHIYLTCLGDSITLC